MIPTKELETTSEQPEVSSSDLREPPVSDPLHSARKRSHFRIEEPQELRHRLAVMLAIGLSWFARIQPSWFRSWLADRSGDLFYLTFKTYRQNVKANLAQVLGLPEDDNTVRKTAIRIFRASSRNFADMLLVPHKTSAEIAADGFATEGDWSVIDDALAAGGDVQRELAVAAERAADDRRGSGQRRLDR